MKKILCVLLILAMFLVMPLYAETSEPSSWAEESVENLKEYNLFREETFSNYKDNITRKDFIYLAVRIYEAIKGENITPNPDLAFNDTNDIYALKGATIGITSGIGNDKFGPDVLLTREQLAVLMVNTMKLAGLELKPAGTYKFDDEANFSSWAKGPVYIAKANGIINGVGDDKFDCSGNATNEVAIIITNKILNSNGIEKKSEIVRIIENETMSMSDILDKFNHSDEAILEINKVSETYDYDNDGLLDYYEIYRNFTDPNNPDSDGDCILDGDWNERNEFTYSYEQDIRLFRNYDLDFMSKHPYQEIMVYETTDEYADVTVRIYPFNILHNTVVGNPNWKKDNLKLIGELRPGKINDWDKEMQEDLLADLLKHGINPEEMTDIEIVFEVINFFNNVYNVSEEFERLFENLEFHMYDWYLVYDEYGNYSINEKALKSRGGNVYEEIMNEVEEARKRMSLEKGVHWTMEDILSLHGSAKKAYYEKLHGSCSGTSLYYANIFQALGIPARVMPIQTAYDSTKHDDDVKKYHSIIDIQIDDLANRQVKEAWNYMVHEDGSGSGHVTNQVFLGNRWVNIDIAGNQKFNYPSIGEFLVFHKESEYDYSDNLSEYTDFWLGFIPSAPASFKMYKSLNFESALDKIGTGVNNFGEKTYSIRDLYGEHIKEDTIEYVNTFDISEYMSSEGRYATNFYLYDDNNRINDKKVNNDKPVFIFDGGSGDDSLISIQYPNLQADFFGDVSNFDKNTHMLENAEIYFLQDLTYDMLPTIIKEKITQDKFKKFSANEENIVKLDNDISLIFIVN